MGRNLAALRQILRLSAPAIALLVSVLLTIAPLQIGLLGLSVPMPVLPLIIVFLYAVYDPSGLAPAVTFSIGVIHDLLYGGAIGPWASVYIAIQFLVYSQREYLRGRVFHVIWLAFALALLVAAPLFWLERSMLAERFLSVWPLFSQFGATVLFYPAVAWGFFSLRDRAAAEVPAV